MGKALEIPFSYGDVLAITGGGAKVVMWFKDENRVIRGVLVDVTDPINPTMAKDEVVFRRGGAARPAGRCRPPRRRPWSRRDSSRS